jgi:nucleoside-diphosphate-sugar epimerase
MNILVVGGAGYIGGALTDILLFGNHHIKLYDNLLYESLYQKPVSFIHGDVRDQKKLETYLNWADAVVWLAAIVGDAACSLDPSLTYSTNVDSLQVLSSYKGRVVFPSTCSVYGASEDIRTETSETNPLSLYAETKLQAEKRLPDNSIVLRLGTIYGLGDSFSRPRLDLVVNLFSAKAAAGQPIEVVGEEQQRPFLHVRDAARALFNALHSEETGTFNLHKENTTIGHVAQVIQRMYPKVYVTTKDINPTDRRNYMVSSDKAREKLGFSPFLTIRKGIKEIGSLVMEKRIKNPSDPVFYNHLKLQQIIKESAT